MKKLDKPIEPGFYWMRNIWRGKPFAGMKPGDADVPEIVHVSADNTVSYVDVGGMYSDELSSLVSNEDVQTEWYGPLTPPWENDK
jgi:hypothetical protein